MAKTAAERKKKQRDKLKATGLFDEFKKRETENRKRLRCLIKQTASTDTRKALRKKKAEEMRRYRNKIKDKKNLELADRHIIEETPTTAFGSKSAYGKAVARAKRNLPFSPTKCRAVVQTLATQIIPNIIISKCKQLRQKISADTLEKIRKFYVRDDISRLSPGIKDTTKVRLENGKKVKMQKRHLFSSILETYALFCEEFGKIIGKSKFAEQRPKHVLLSSETPANLCLCKYHENYILAVNAFAKNCKDFMSYDNSFLAKFALCKAPTVSCWYDRCATCKTMMRSKLEQAVVTIRDKEVKWHVWKEENGRLRKVSVKGTMLMLCEHILRMTPVFKEHSYVKRNQAQSYNNDRKDSMNSKFKFALLQVDFAENYKCVAQDEIQSFHWTKPQVSLFTVSLWYHQRQHAFVLVSDNINHNKDTVICYIHRIFQEIPIDIKEVRIWSDGPASHFKNRFVGYSLPILEKYHNLKITWNFFATSHGKGPVDGIGGAIKRQVRNSVLRRKKIVSDAQTFADAVSEHSTVQVILMNDEIFPIIHEKLGLRTIFEKASFIKGIKQMHKIYVNSFNIVKALQLSCMQRTTYEEVYSDDNSEDENGDLIIDNSPDEKENDNPTTEAGPSVTLSSGLELTTRNIQNGVYVLTQFASTDKRKTAFRYLTICQSGVDEEGEVKVMSLKVVNDDASLFTTDEKDISYVSFEDILEILPTPSLVLKGNRIYYKFPKKLDIFQKS